MGGGQNTQQKNAAGALFHLCPRLRVGAIVERRARNRFVAERSLEMNGRLGGFSFRLGLQRALRDAQAEGD